jgi:hypothetical protein
VLLSYKVTPQPLRVIFAILGTISLGSTVAGVFLPEWGPFGQLELGGVERWMVYPVLLWLVGFGGFLAASHPNEGQPGTAATQALGGCKEAVRSSR